MFKLILEHEYTRSKPAVDSSRFMQHGRVIDTTYNTDGRITGSGALEFSVPSAEVRVPTGSAWVNLRAIAIEVWVKLNTLTGQRQNIIEGDNAFALFVEPGGAVVASFLGLIQGQSTVQWNSVSTDSHSPSGTPLVLQPGVWTLITLVFDGFGRARIWLDNTLAGVRTDFTTGVGSVASAGIVIGNWTLRNQYWFSGQIDSVRVWKEDPTAPIAQFFSRLKGETERQSWDRFFDCLARSHSDQKQQYQELAEIWDTLIRQLIRELYRTPEAQRKEFFLLLHAYLDAWKNNTISSSDHVANVLKLQKLMESIGGDDFAQQFRQFINLVSETSKDGNLECFWKAEINTTDSEFASFIKQVTVQLSA